MDVFNTHGQRVAGLEAEERYIQIARESFRGLVLWEPPQVISNSVPTYHQGIAAGEGLDARWTWLAIGLDHDDGACVR